MSTVATAHADQLAIGDTIAHPCGTVTLAVQRVGVEAWRVSVNDGLFGGFLGAEVDGASFPTFGEALHEYARMYRAYDELQTREKVTEEYEKAAILAEYWLKRYGPEAKARAIKFEKRRDALMPLGARAVQARLAARWTMTPAAAAA